jgi:hypothetical protein
VSEELSVRVWKGRWVGTYLAGADAGDGVVSELKLVDARGDELLDARDLDEDAGQLLIPAGRVADVRHPLLQESVVAKSELAKPRDL